MSTVQLVIVCVTVLLLAGTLRAPLPRRYRTGQRVTIHTRLPDDRSVTGIVEAETAERVRLIDAEYVTSDGTVAVPGGVAILPKANEALRQEHN